WAITSLSQSGSGSRDGARPCIAVRSRCTWAFTRPGITAVSPRSTSGVRDPWGSTATMRSPSMVTTPPASGGAATGETQRAVSESVMRTSLLSFAQPGDPAVEPLLQRLDAIDHRRMFLDDVADGLVVGREPLADLLREPLAHGRAEVGRPSHRVALDLQQRHVEPVRLPQVRPGTEAQHANALVLVELGAVFPPDQVPHRP